MASSRWKRFAFFEKQSLSVPPEVLNDLFPQHASKSGSLSHSLAAESSFDGVSLAVTTASLPLKSKPPALPSIPQITEAPLPSDTDNDALSQMWLALNACTMAELGGDVDTDIAAAGVVPNVSLHSQSQKNEDLAFSGYISGQTIEGLVLAFAASKETGLVHCFDVTVRCNPLSEARRNLEDLDGWRGYFSPFSQLSSATTRRDTGSVQSTANESAPGVIAVASCRSEEGHRPLYVACAAKQQISVLEDPHLHLSRHFPLARNLTSIDDCTCYLLDSWNTSKDGAPSAVDIVPGIVCVGTDTGVVLVCTYGSTSARSAGSGIQRYLRIPAPPQSLRSCSVVSVRCAVDGERKVSVFVAYRRSQDSQNSSSSGICCYDMPAPSTNSSSSPAPSVSARHDLDGRNVSGSGLCDAVVTREGLHFTVARNDGLYTYSRTQKISVSPIEGTKEQICLVPRPLDASYDRDLSSMDVGSNYVLVASKDSKSDRDVIDIYDSTNKLVAFHLLLSPGHRAVKGAGVTTSRSSSTVGKTKSCRSSAVVLTSGGSLITFTEKTTDEKVQLLVQKNLFSAAVAVAYADPSLEPSAVTSLYRKYAEHLYRKGDYTASIEQYCHTIGSLESSHVIFRFLDAPKIPLLAQYLEKLKERELATPVHCQLLRTCYLKLNDSEAADSIATTTPSSLLGNDSLQSFSTNLAYNPRDALSTICSMSPQQAAEMLTEHGAALARAMPKETAGIVVALCLGTFKPESLSEAATGPVAEANKMLSYALDERDKTCEPYPVRLFYAAFLDNPKMLRLILAHLNRNKCHLTPSLRRTLLELTLDEWNQAKRSGDTEGEKLRHREAIAALTDSHCHEIGDYDALVIVQEASFDEGELLLYERLQMGPMLLSRYAHERSEKSMRQMMAMSKADPEVLSEVLGHLVSLVSEAGNLPKDQNENDDYSDDGNGPAQILGNIHEALEIASEGKAITPVRITRILAGESTEQFSGDVKKYSSGGQQTETVPLSVALEYVGMILDESRTEITRLKSEIQEYNQLCNSLEAQVESLLNNSPPPSSEVANNEDEASARMDIDAVYAKVRMSIDRIPGNDERPREAFWRELGQTEEPFETITRFFAKGVVQ
ncbi:sorting-associated protein 11 homolog [Seminavis robusta]|uniref:Sorting-associated protein 11 homolog n=1 Tax=Seminavis robusta TaxID=568900 RepID=A0A9N8E750_9STRA|nr:sorting-associated protein 11 homolog [Seminavis robusta]|eukprot:Sro750_g197030.1 sorting-associated protein 11 homolog (1115) ;mRNA; r:37219-41141